MHKPLVLTIATVVSGVIIIGSVLLLVMVNTATTSTVSCDKKGSTYQVSIQNGVVKPSTTNAKLCDSITFTNADPETRKIGFGNHDKHVEFSGVETKILHSGQSFTLVITESGSIGFHDHYNHDTEGTLTVTD